MVRYIMSFTVSPERHRHALEVIDRYFEALQRNGPGGMRSQCYANHDDDCSFVHIKSFRKESVAHHHFRSSHFREYADRLAALCGKRPAFSQLTQQQTFESIY
ncbi:MAG: antibiotic biosynthesis monooxygenase [Chitinophagaceae bacterium]